MKKKNNNNNNWIGQFDFLVDPLIELNNVDFGLMMTLKDTQSINRSGK